jgi:ubiquinone/menaquinone biosynthesis C-methylase UbiE
MTKQRTVFETPLQYIELQKLPSNNLILDVGGGGEGLASRIGKQRVCSIDYRMSEIREAKIHGAPANWFTCDAQSLCFMDSIFDLATIWFSLGYMRTEDTKRSVLKEVFRVLKPEATVSLMASKVVCEEDVFVIHILYTLPDGTESKTGYGVTGNQIQTLETILKLLTKMGFQIKNSREHEYWFYIEAYRP